MPQSNTKNYHNKAREFFSQNETMVEIQHGAARNSNSEKYAMWKFQCRGLKNSKLIFVTKFLELLKTLLEKKNKPIFHSPLSRFSLIVLTDKCLYLGRINETILDFVYSYKLW